MLAGIHGDYHLGSNYEQGGRVPMIAGWCTPSAPGFGDAEAYNFVFSTLAEGARGVGVYSYYWGLQSPSDCLAGYADAFNVLRDPVHPLGEGSAPRASQPGA